MRKHGIFICLILLCKALNCNAQLPAGYTLYATKDGLVHNSVNTITQDNFGFMWFGTDEGVSRFDGTVFRTILSRQNQPAGWVYGFKVKDMCVDNMNRVWMTVNDSTLIYYDYKTGKIKMFATNTGSHIVYDKARGCIWALISHTLVHISTTNLTITNTAYTNIANTGGITLDADNNLWLYTKNWNGVKGSYYINFVTGIVKRFEKGWCFYSDTAHKKMWMGTWNEGLLCYNFSTSSLQEFYSKTNGLSPSNFAMEAINKGGAVFADSVLLLGSRDAGLVQFNTAGGKMMHVIPTNELQTRNIFGYTVNSIFNDAQKNVWIATINGLVKYTNEQTPFTLKISPLTTAGFYKRETIVVNNGNKENTYWAGFWGDGIAECTTDGRVIQAFGHSVTNNYSLADEHRFVQAVVKDRRNNVWVGSEGGLQLIRNKNISTVQAAKALDIMFLQNDADSILWAGTATGLYRYNMAAQSIAKVGTVADSIIVDDVLQDKAKPIVWVANKQGLYEIDKKTLAATKVFPAAEGNVRVFDITDDEQGRVWMDTEKGLFCYDAETGSTVSYANITGYATRMNYSLIFIQYMFITGNNLWAYTNTGLMRMDVITHSINFYTKQDGLYYEHPFNYGCYSTSKDSIYLWYEGEYTAFAKSINTKSTNVPSAYITGASVNNGPLLQATENNDVHFVLSPGQSFISFEYTGIDLIHSQEIRYRYKLDGLDNTWRNGGSQHTVTYTNLKPYINYRFLVQCSNNNNIWSAPATIYFYVKPPFYLTIWFVCLCILILVVSCWWLVLLRIKYIRKTEQQKMQHLQQLGQVEMKALRAQMNPHFIFNTLNSINSYVIDNNIHKAQDYIARFAMLIRLMLDNSRQETITLSKELDTLKLYMEIENLRLDNKFDFIIERDEELDALSISIPSMILQPYTENAIWHGFMNSSKHRNILHIAYKKLTEHILKIDITDNGIGRAAAGKFKHMRGGDKQSHGIQITSERIRLHHPENSIVIQDVVDANQQPAGTAITIYIHYN